MKTAQSYSKISKTLQILALIAGALLLIFCFVKKAYAHVDLIDPMFLEREWQKYKELCNKGTENQMLTELGVYNDRPDGKESDCTTSRD